MSPRGAPVLWRTATTPGFKARDSVWGKAGGPPGGGGTGQAFLPSAPSEALETALTQGGAGSALSSGNEPNLPETIFVSAPETGGRLDLRARCLLWIRGVGVRVQRLHPTRGRQCLQERASRRRAEAGGGLRPPACPRLATAAALLSGTWSPGGACSQARQEETVASEPRIAFLPLPQTHSLEPFFLSWFPLGA